MQRACALDAVGLSTGSGRAIRMLEIAGWSAKSGALRAELTRSQLGHERSPGATEGGPVASLARPESDRMIGGVSAAIANRFGWPVPVVRLATVAAMILPGAMIAYGVLWVLIPREKDS